MCGVWSDMGARLGSRFAGTDHGGRLDEIVFFPSDDGGRRCFRGPCTNDGSLPTCVDGAWGEAEVFISV